MALNISEHWLDLGDTGQLYYKQWRPDGSSQASAAPIVLFHDSLGCVELWRDFPGRLATISGRTVIAYDRLGFGRSDPHPGVLPLDFIDREADAAFACLSETLGLDAFIALGHSVGGAMATTCAARYPLRCTALVAISALTCVEDRTREGIRASEAAFEAAEQMERLGKYHGSKAHWVLRAWVDTWCSDAFRQWDLAPAMQQVQCPTLALHGDADEYGSTLHPERFEAHTPQAKARVIPACGHFPHRSAPDAVLDVIQTFLATITTDSLPGCQS